MSTTNNMAKEKQPIVINNFQKGIAASPYFGFEEMRRMDISTTPGVVTPVLSLINYTDDSAVDSLITGIVKNPGTSDYYGMSSTKIFKVTPAEAVTVKTGHSTGTLLGIDAYKGYMIVAVGAKLDGYDGTTWDQAFVSTLSDSSSSHPMCWASDDRLYIGSGRYVDVLYEKDGQNFDPASSATFTFTANGLDLPEGEVIKKIVELGGNVYMVCQNKMYPWDKQSTTFGYPVTFNDLTINTAIVYNNLIYVQAGSDGKWYVTNGTSVRLLSKLPDNVTGGYITINPNSCTLRNGLIVFGGNLSATTADLHRGAGVWTLDPDTGALNYENVISTGQDGGTSNYGIDIGCIVNTAGSSSQLIVTWNDQNNNSNPELFGIDITGTLRSATDTNYIITQFYSVGTRLHPRPFDYFKVQLTKPLVSPDSVKVYYRTAINSTSWTQIGGTFDTVGSSSWTGFFGPVVENIQFKIVLNRNAELLEAIAY